MSSDRTEKATPKRREDARRKGQVARRPELAAAAGFLAALFVLRLTSGDINTRVKNLFASAALDFTNGEPLTVPAVHNLFIEAVTNVLWLSLPVVTGALVAGIVGNFAQGGLTLAPGALAFKSERFSPAANIKRAYSLNSIVELAKGLLKLAGICFACYGVFAGALESAPAMLGVPPADAMRSIGALIYDVLLRAGSILFLVAAADYGYGWYQHEKSLRMTKQEIRDEYKQQEGDPMVKGQRRRAARAILQRQVAREVPLADVVVMNPTHFAVALRYDTEKDAAPVVVAKGKDLMALRIRDIARASDVRVVENPPLARALFRAVEVNRHVPPDLFRAVAELLAYVYRLNTQAGRTKPRPGVDRTTP